jgi:hypothetical protein
LSGTVTFYEFAFFSLLERFCLDKILVYSNELITLDESASKSEPFSFWEKWSGSCPQIYNVAVDVLSIPATSAPSERVFSRASFVLARNRHNLSDEKLEMEVFYKMNSDFL